MNLLNYLFFVKKRLLYKKIMLITNIMVITLAFFLLSYLTVEYMFINNFRYEATNFIKKDVKMCGTARIYFSTETNEKEIEKWQNCLQEISNSEVIESIGCWERYIGYLSDSDRESDKVWKKMVEISNKNQHFFDQQSMLEMQMSYDKYIDAVSIPPECFQFVKLDLDKGSFDGIEKNSKHLLYLGYNFKDIPLGTVFYNKEDKIEFEVAGILKENSRILNGDYLLCGSSGGNFCTDIMDNAILYVTPFNQNGNFYSEMNLFSVKDGYTYEDGKQIIEKIANKCGYQSNCGAYLNRIDSLVAENDWMIEALSKLILLLVVSSTIIVFVCQLLLLNMKKNELGMWLVCGISRKSISLIMLIENLLKFGISAFISYIIIHSWWFMRYESKVIEKERYEYIFTSGVVPALLISSLLLTVCVSVFTIWVLKKQTIREQLAAK